MKWELIQICKLDKPTIFRKISPKAHVSLLKLTPFSLPMEPKTKYLVIESFGVGNIPTSGPFYEWLKKNS